MHPMRMIIVSSMIALGALTLPVMSQVLMHEPCDDVARWHPFSSEGVSVAAAPDAGPDGTCLRFDFSFKYGSGYGGVILTPDVELPVDFSVSFSLKSDSPVNNFEVKISDNAGGENIWWVNRRHFRYPRTWERFTLRKRHFQFAWGPNPAPAPKRIRRIEFVVTAGSGGHGSVFLDDVVVEGVVPPPADVPVPRWTASSALSAPAGILADPKGGSWKSRAVPLRQWMQVDFGYQREFGALRLDWGKEDYAAAFSVLASTDGRTFHPAYSVERSTGGTMFLPLPDASARFVRFELDSASRGRGYEIKAVRFFEPESVATLNDLYTRIASESRAGLFPRYLLRQASYWTVVGVDGDTEESLINEEGMFEVDKQSFSIEPFLQMDGKLITWADSRHEHSLEDSCLPIPHVDRTCGPLRLALTLLAAGSRDSSMLLARYVLTNSGPAPSSGRLFLAIRPFQTNPPYQFLNAEGGVARIDSIQFDGRSARVNNKSVVFLPAPDRFGSVAYDQRDIAVHLEENTFPERRNVTDPRGLASGAAMFSFSLARGASMTVVVAVPFHAVTDGWRRVLAYGDPVAMFRDTLGSMREFWNRKTGAVNLSVPADQRIVRTLRANLAYILVNRDGPGIQPGSRSYERSWIRDGSITSTALLRFGLASEVKEFIKWYGSHQYENGKIPCVVDCRGPDPVPEHDSHGEFIYACLEYFYFTHDTAFLRAEWPKMRRAVDFIQSLRAERLTDYYAHAKGEDRAKYGLVTESISHEGYSDKPRHSYWDNFFVLKGFKDAARAAQILGLTAEGKMLDSLATAFHRMLDESIVLVMGEKKVPYIPGCVELGDFDATSTSIAAFPTESVDSVLRPAFERTFDRYWDFVTGRMRGELAWENYTPYEIRTIGTLVSLGRVEQAHELLNWFFRDQRPPGWHHWAEVVWRDPRMPRFIGDMPHTWVGSEYINAVRSMFAAEHVDDATLVLAPGVPPAWLPDGVRVGNMPTIFGSVTYNLQRSGAHVLLTVSGTVDPAVVRVLLPVSLGRERLLRADINGLVAQDEGGFVRIPAFPATVRLTYAR